MEITGKRMRISTMIKNWNSARWIHESAYKLLNSGSFFSITRDDVELWSANTPKSVFAYFGLENDKLFFILLDDKTGSLSLDKMSDEDLNKVIIREFNDDLPLLDFDFIDNVTDGANLTVREALSRNLRWQMMKESWIKEQLSVEASDETGLGRVFTIPFSDLSNILKNQHINQVAAVTGLKLNSKAEKQADMYELDLSFWGILTKPKVFARSLMRDNYEEAPVEDLSRLSPPFHYSDTTLL
jgi:hypothetical protein